jgi:6-phosphogluconolactonase
VSSDRGEEGLQVEIVPLDALAGTVARLIARRLREAIDRRGLATLAVSGGHTPLPAFDALTQLDVPWQQVHVLQVDERIAPDGDPARNAVGLRAHLLDAVSVPEMNVHLIPVDGRDPDAAAAAYLATLQAVAGTPAVLDVVQLGLGDDGHTASLFPGDPVLGVTDRDVAPTATAHHGHRRITLTYPTLARARDRVWMVAGADKADAVARLSGGDPSSPASHLAVGPAWLVVDEAAAGGLPATRRAGAST